MTATDVHGPVDFVLLEFEADRMKGKAADELIRLVDAGTIRLFDILFIGKDSTGEVFVLDLAAEALADVRLHRSRRRAIRADVGRGCAGGGQGNGARDRGRTHRLREHLGDPLRSRGP